LSESEDKPEHTENKKPEEYAKGSIASFIKGLQWQDYAFICLILVYLFFQIGLLSSYKQLPSPIYGGDFYYSLGTIQHFMSGGNPFVSSNFLGSEPGYLAPYAICVGLVGMLLGLPAFEAMKAFSVFFMIVALIVFYLFISHLFKNKSAALVSIMFFMPLTAFPVLKYNTFTLLLVFPSFLFSLYTLMRKKNFLWAIVSGLALGFCGISHTSVFVAALFFFGTASLFMLFFEHLHKEGKSWNFDKESFKKSIGKTMLLLAIICVLAAAISMLYWYKPIFVYHGALPQGTAHMHSFPTFGSQAKQAWDSLKYAMFNFSDLLTGAKSVLFIIGILSIFLVKKYDAFEKFMLIILIATFLGSFHHLLTEPILGINLAVQQVAEFSFNFTSAIFAAYGAVAISSLLKKYKLYIIIFFIALLLLFNIMQFNNYSKNDQWVKAGRADLSPNLASMQNWVLKNTGVDDVFLSTNELNFALNSLTGRKIVNGRRSHSSMFLDHNQRHAVAAVMLYGNDTGERKALLKEYSVNYIYWDYYWFQSEFYFDKDGKLTSWFDPLMVVETPEYLGLLQRNNVSFFRQYTWLDPTIKFETMPKFNAMIVLPYQFSLEHPWHPDLDNYLQEVWNYSQNGQALSRIYKIVNVD